MMGLEKYSFAKILNVTTRGELHMRKGLFLIQFMSKLFASTCCVEPKYEPKTQINMASFQPVYNLSALTFTLIYI